MEKILNQFHLPLKPSNLDALEKYPSLKTIELIETLLNISREFGQAILELKTETLKYNYKDFFFADELKEKADNLYILIQHLTEILKNKTEIISQIQKPFSGDHIRVNYQQQKKFYEILSSFSRDISNHKTQLNNLTYSFNFSLSDKQLENTLEILSSSLVTYQRYFNSLSKTESTLVKVTEIKMDNKK